MYIANRELELANGKLARVGEPVDTSKWDYPVLKSHLDLEWLIEVKDEKEAKKIFEAPKQEEKSLFRGALKRLRG